MIVRYEIGAVRNESSPMTEIHWCGKNGNFAPWLCACQV